MSKLLQYGDSFSVADTRPCKKKRNPSSIHSIIQGGDLIR